MVNLLNAIIPCVNLTSQILISAAGIHFNSDTYNPKRVEIRNKVKDSLTKYFSHTNLPETCESHVLTNNRFLDIIGYKVQQLHPNSECLSTLEFYQAVKQVIGSEAVKRIADKNQNPLLDLNNLSGLDLSLKTELDKRLGKDKLNMKIKTQDKIKAFILEARKADLYQNANSDKQNSKLAKLIIKTEIAEHFDLWFNESEKCGKFKLTVHDMIDAAAEKIGDEVEDAIAGGIQKGGAELAKYLANNPDFQIWTRGFEELVDFAQEGQKFIHDGKVFLKKAGELVDVTTEVMQTGNNVLESVDETFENGVSISMDVKPISPNKGDSTDVSLAGKCGNEDLMSESSI